MKMTRTWVSTAIALSAIAAAGCDANQFNTFNEQFSTLKTSSNALKSSTLPAAAMATSLAAVEVMNALSTESGNIIAPGGGNIIAPGGGNYALFQASSTQTGGVKTTSNLDKETKTGTLTSTRGDKKILDLTFGYDMTQSDKTVSYELKDLKGGTNGFTVDVDGKYAYTWTGERSGGKPVADISCEVTGTMASSQSKFTIEKLAFNMRYNDDSTEKKELGAVLLTGPTGKIDIKIFLAGTTVTGAGKLMDKAGNVLQSLTLDESGNATFEDATADAK
ncbi:MAG: hypothetical protein ACLGIN_18450 [Candidatus Sericytochromatia bacterium]